MKQPHPTRTLRYTATATASLLAALALAASPALAQLKVGSNPTGIDTDANLQVESTIGQQFLIRKDTGFVGIGTTDPQNLLHVESGSDGTSGVRMQRIPNAAVLSTDTNGNVEPNANISVVNGRYRLNAPLDINNNNAVAGTNLNVGTPMDIRGSTAVELFYTREGAGGIRYNMGIASDNRYIFLNDRTNNNFGLFLYDPANRRFQFGEEVLFFDGMRLSAGDLALDRGFISITNANSNTDLRFFNTSSNANYNFQACARGGCGGAPDGGLQIYDGNARRTLVHLKPGDQNGWYGGSDISLKRNIHTLDNVLEKIDLFRGVAFEWKSSGEKSVGVIAQELQQAYPELVGEPGTDGTLSVPYANGISTIALQAAKELKALVEQQRQEIDALKAEMAQLRQAR